MRLTTCGSEAPASELLNWNRDDGTATVESVGDGADGSVGGGTGGSVDDVIVGSVGDVTGGSVGDT